MKLLASTPRLNRGLALMAGAVVLCAVAVSVFGARLGLRASGASGQDARHAAAAEDGRARKYVERWGLWPSMHPGLAALGDRLEKPGKERTMLSGTISLGDGSEARPFAVTREYPDALTVEDYSGGERAVISYDGTRPPQSERALTPEQEAVLETLLYDTPEHFFRAKSDGLAAFRFRGARFRPAAGASAEEPRGPSYDVFEATEPAVTSAGSPERTRRYYFNSDTHLLEKVRYSVERGGIEVRVEVTLGGWRRFEGQALPTRVMRTEDGSPVVTVNFAQASVGLSALTETAPR